jgi:hypothetical protein
MFLQNNIDVLIDFTHLATSEAAAGFSSSSDVQLVFSMAPGGWCGSPSSFGAVAARE